MKNKGKIIANVILFFISIFPFIMGTIGVKTIIFNGFFDGAREIEKVFSIFGNLILIISIGVFVIALALAVTAILLLVGCIEKKQENEENDIKKYEDNNMIYKIIILVEIFAYIMLFISTKI